MPISRTELFERMTALGIKTTTVDHPAVRTVADTACHDLNLPGADTKNLFLKDDKGNLVLVIAKTSTEVDLKALPKKIGCGRFSFGKPDLLMEVLGVEPGSVTAFAVINDVAKRVRVIVDQALLGYDSVNCHPLENTATTNIARDDLLRFIRSTGHDPEVVTLSST